MPSKLSKTKRRAAMRKEKIMKKKSEKAEKEAPAKTEVKKQEEGPSKEFQALAEVINANMEVDPPLDKNAPDLENQIKEIMGEIEEGNITKASCLETLKGLGWAPKEKAPAKTKKEKAPKAKKEKALRDFSKSNKAIIYLAWNKGKGETDPTELLKTVKNGVKETTIKSWIGSWKRDQGLPAIANK